MHVDDNPHRQRAHRWGLAVAGLTDVAITQTIIYVVRRRWLLAYVTGALAIVFWLILNVWAELERRS